MKKHFLNAAFLSVIIALTALILPADGATGKTAAVEKELNAIANLLEAGGNIMAIDVSKVSGEFCMLESGTKNNMVHFSGTPESTPEDIIYFISPDAFKGAGLRVGDLSPLPTKLGKMSPLKWYYYDGKAKEPHHGKKLHRDFLVMAIDVK